MREILFRGKRLDNGEWAEGFYISHLNACHYIIPFRTGGYEAMDNSFYVHKWFEVDPSTIGQYTGLHDATKWENLPEKEQQEFLRIHKKEDWNGKKIFEGDIVKADNGKHSSVSVVKFGEYYPKMFYAMLDMFMPGVPHLNANGFYAASTKHEDMILFKSRLLVVIGNIHDNKSLLNNQEAGE